MKLLILTILAFQFLHSQPSELIAKYQEGDKAFQSQDFDNARLIYESLTKVDSENNKSWFNLGVVELTLGNIEAGCICMKSALKLQHSESEKILKEYCSDYFVPFDQLDVKPSFSYRKKEYPLFSSKNALNPKFIQMLVAELESCKHLMTFLHPGSIFIELNFETEGLRVEIKRVPAAEHEKRNVKNLVLQAFKTFNYKTGQKLGKDVAILELWRFPITLQKPMRDFEPYRRGN